MKQELVDELVRLAPNFFSKDPERPSPYSQRGFEVCDGWFEIVKSVALAAEEDLAALPDGIRSQIRCSQVKEKFGGLRVYVDGPVWDVEAKASRMPRFDAALDEGARKAWTTCEECGAPAKRRNLRGYLFVVCDEHFAAAKKRR